MSDQDPPGSIGDRAYQRRFRDKGNKRDDWAMDVFRQVFARLDDPARVDRLLFDLGRYYNPLTDGPIVDIPTRRRVADCLAKGAVEEARRLIETCRDRYRGGIDDGLGGPEREIDGEARGDRS